MASIEEKEPIMVPSWSIVLYIIAGLNFAISIFYGVNAIIAAFCISAIIVALGRILDYTNEIAIRMRHAEDARNEQSSK